MIVLINIISLYLMFTYIKHFLINRTLGGIAIPDFTTAFVVIVVLSLANAVLWPVLGYFSLRFIVITLGFGTFLIDGILLYIISLFIPGVYIEGISLFSIPLLIGLISSFLSLACFLCVLRVSARDTNQPYPFFSSSSPVALLHSTSLRAFIRWQLS